MTACCRWCCILVALLTYYPLTASSAPIPEESRHHAQDGPHWTYYGDTGPQRWKLQHPECGGQSQSPVPLDTTLAKPVHGPQLMWFGWRHTPDKQRLQNNGHTVALSSDWKNPAEYPQVWFAGSDTRYRLHHLHFHWGATDSEGSEHTLNGERFPLEMHVVTYDKSYPDVHEAKKHPRGLLVIGYFFRKSQSEKDPLLKLISKHLQRVMRHGSSHTLPKVRSLSALVPSFSKSFFLYSGSLTTPPCSQVVTWVLNKDVRTVSSYQLKQLRQVLDTDDKPLIRNWRPLQQLNNRQLLQVI